MTEAASTPEVPQKDLLSLDAFARELPKLLSNELHSKLRCAECGLFVSEDMVDPILHAYSTWFHKVTGHEKELGEGKLRRRVFGSEQPELFYLLDGKACLVGYVAPGANLSSLRLSIPSCIGSLLKTSDSLHPRDPIFGQLDGTKATLTGDGFSLEVNIGTRSVIADKLMLERFGELVQRSRNLQRLMPGRAFSRRAALKAFLRCLRKARRKGSGRSLFIPSRFRSRNDIEYRVTAGVVFVIEQNKVTTCYGLYGPILWLFLNEELAELGRSLKKRRQGVFEIIPGGKYGGQIRFHLKEEHFTLDTRALSQIVNDCQRDRSFHGKQFTFFDVLRGAAKLFEHSGWVAPDRVPKRFAQFAKGFPRVRSAYNWYFFIDKTNTIRRIVPVHAEKQWRVLSGEKMGVAPR